MRFYQGVSKTFRRCFSSKALPAEADVVIVGGGAQGASTLYHLQDMGVNAVLLEKDELTAGTTWHSAGLVWRLRPSDVDIMLIKRTRDLAKKIEKDLGVSTGWQENGGLFVASTEVRLNEYKRLQTLGKYFDIETTILDAADTKELYPLMNVDDILGCLYSPGDGCVEPAEYTSALARYARKKGGVIHEKVDVVGFEHDNNIMCPKVTKVITDKGAIKTNHVVICGGVWSRDILKPLGIDVPLCAMKHAYVLTEPIEGIRGMPNVRDHDASVYLRVQGSALQVGGYEQNPVFWDDVDPKFHFGLFDLDWDAFGQNFEGGMNRIPIVGETGVKTTVCGPESFTPDHKPLLGEVPGMRGMWLNCGFNSAGLMLSGGCGHEIAHWIVHGCSSIDMFGYDINRYCPEYTDNTQWIKSRSHEAYAKNYSIVFPKDEPLAGRTMSHRTPFHEKLIEMGMVHQERHSWERPGWVSPGSPAPLLDYDYYGAYEDTPSHEVYEYRDRLEDDYTFVYPTNHDLIGNEVKAAREGVAFYDQSYFGKFFISGKDALQALQWICTNNLDKPIGSTVYTNMCNKFGKSECDLTVSRIGEDSFYIASGGGSRTHDWGHIRNIIMDNNWDVQMQDRTKDFTMISVQGRDSRPLLEKLSPGTDFSLEAWPFSTTQNIKVCGYDVQVIRLTFVGEMGWELHIPLEHSPEIFENLLKEGKQFDLQASGYRAIDSLSAEKGYLHWHEDIRPDDTPLEANIGFVCKLKTDIPFLGREALEKQQEEGLKRRLVFIRVPESVKLHGLETLWRDGECVGYLRRADFDYTENTAIGYAYVSRKDKKKVTLGWIRGSEKNKIPTPNYEIEVMGKRYACAVDIKPTFDSKNERIKGNYKANAC